MAEPIDGKAHIRMISEALQGILGTPAPLHEGDAAARIAKAVGARSWGLPREKIFGNIVGSTDSPTGSSGYTKTIKGLDIYWERSPTDGRVGWMAMSIDRELLDLSKEELGECIRLLTSLHKAMA